MNGHRSRSDVADVMVAVSEECRNLMMDGSPERELKSGNTSLFAELFTLHRARIWQIVHFRLNDQIRGRVDPDDVIQEIYLAAKQRLKHFIEGDFPSLFLWLRLVAYQTLSSIHRTHLGTESRSVMRESGPPGAAWSESTRQCLSQRFIAHFTTPSQVAMKAELIVRVRESLESLSEIDREVVALRHFEELTNQVVATELGIAPKAASIRYM